MKIIVLIAILRAKSRKTESGAVPTKPRNTNADPSGLTSGRSALNVSAKDLKRRSTLGIAKQHSICARRSGLLLEPKPVPEPRRTTCCQDALDAAWLLAYLNR